MKKILLYLIKIYRKSFFVRSPVLKALFITDRCIYQPTCSNYCAQAIEKYGALKGFFICARRIMRCHPWGKGGVDKLV